MSKTFLNLFFSDNTLAMVANGQVGYSSFNVSNAFKGRIFTKLYISVVYLHANSSSKGLLPYIVYTNTNLQFAPISIQVSHTSNIPANITSTFFAEFNIPSNYPQNNFSIEMINCEDAAISGHISIFVS